jgi:hypothetical protein
MFPFHCHGPRKRATQMEVTGDSIGMSNKRANKLNDLQVSAGWPACAGHDKEWVWHFLLRSLF